MLREGQTIAGKYRLVRLLGVGGFASVWEATNIHLERRVALKILSDNLSQRSDLVERFLREAKLAAREIHPAVVRVEDIGKIDDQVPFMVMEYLDGRTLEDELHEVGPLPLPRFFELGGVMLQGIASAHEQGIIHRDLKPANIFLTDSASSGPLVRILDLGLGKDLGRDEKLTETGEIFGTMDYIAPEAFFSGVFRAASPQIDVYALGIIFFEMLTGRHPLDGLVEREPSAKGVLSLASFFQTEGPLPVVSTFRAGLSPEIDALVGGALAIDPEKRYADALGVSQAFDRAKGAGVEDVPVGHRGEVSASHRNLEAAHVRSPGGGRKIVIGLLSTGLLIVGALVVGAFVWMSDPLSTGPSRATDKPQMSGPSMGLAKQVQQEIEPYVSEGDTENPSAAAQEVDASVEEASDGGAQVEEPTRAPRVTKVGTSPREQGQETMDSGVPFHSIAPNGLDHHEQSPAIPFYTVGAGGNGVDR